MGVSPIIKIQQCRISRRIRKKGERGELSPISNNNILFLKKGRAPFPVLHFQVCGDQVPCRYTRRWSVYVAMGTLGWCYEIEQHATVAWGPLFQKGNRPNWVQQVASSSGTSGLSDLWDEGGLNEVKEGAWQPGVFVSLSIHTSLLGGRVFIGDFPLPASGTFNVAKPSTGSA